MVDFSGKVKEQRPKNFVISKVLSRTMDPRLYYEDFEMAFNISSVKFINHEASMNPKELGEAWNIAEEVARRTIMVTSRMCPRNTHDISLNRRYAYNDRMLRYRHSPVVMYSDTMFASKQVGKSVRNFTCAQVFATDFGWVAVYLLEFESEV